ncbi:probable ubiquitin-conjugating enzyme E2 W-B isoform X5 [Chiloscyllium plagiosum]|uniref:probable ubiquitin-conjugating enzyme E2 W-B isoform X5 n=1 Tax=Chiloscyllium plagiosum TaxID=36176 RepID=UPI001CB84C53|nr:probable ubiquitin-conjugating enzyme E2 W-B isoform X5 [Chiloscyllium plagiosum]
MSDFQCPQAVLLFRLLRLSDQHRRSRRGYQRSHVQGARTPCPRDGGDGNHACASPVMAAAPSRPVKVTGASDTCRGPPQEQQAGFRRHLCHRRLLLRLRLRCFNFRTLTLLLFPTSSSRRVIILSGIK